MSVCLLVTANFFGTKNAYCNHNANHNKDDIRDQDEKDVASKVKVILATLIIKIILEWYKLNGYKNDVSTRLFGEHVELILFTILRIDAKKKYKKESLIFS